MSDGNFNRSLLPHTEFHNGYRAATTRTKILAIEAFKETLKTLSLDEAQISSLTDDFCSRLNEKVKGSK